MKTFLIILMLLYVLPISCQNPPENKTDFRKISYKELQDEAIKLIGDDWMLVAAGNKESYNMMTANWGGLGWLWNKPVAFIFVRPQRYTFEFTEKEAHFTLSFYEEQDKDILKLMGSKSGRDFNKMAYQGLTSFETENGSIGFKEARLILECKKIYRTTIKASDFIDEELDSKIYPKKDYHILYIGEITNILVN